MLPVFQERLQIYNYIATPFRDKMGTAKINPDEYTRMINDDEFKLLCIALSDTILALAKKPEPKIDDDELHLALMIVESSQSRLTLALAKALKIEETLDAVTPVPEDRVLRATLDLEQAVVQAIKDHVSERHWSEALGFGENLTRQVMPTHIYMPR